METCATCRFYMPHNADGGICRRYPPQLLLLTNVMRASPQNPMGNGVTPNLPGVAVTFWCGEYASKGVALA